MPSSKWFNAASSDKERYVKLMFFERLRMLSAIIAIVSLIVSIFSAVTAYLIHRQRLKTEFKTQDSAEKLIRSLLEQPNWSKRSFDSIASKVGGFDGDDLRQLLVRAGAVRFYSQDGKELWGLLSKNTRDLS